MRKKNDFFIYYLFSIKVISKPFLNGQFKNALKVLVNKTLKIISTGFNVHKKFKIFSYYCSKFLCVSLSYKLF